MCVFLFIGASAWAGPCDELSALEKPAALGQLPAEVIVCLEKMRDAGEPARRESASLLLIANAFACHDDASWSRHVKYHLESVDTGDCDLMYRYGRQLLKSGAPRDALTWIDSAATHSYGWPANALEAKLFELRRLKTKAQWALYEQLGEDAGMEKRAALGKVQLAAVEWIRAGNKQARDVTEALSYCTRTGWTRDRCEQQASL